MRFLAITLWLVMVGNTAYAQIPDDVLRHISVTGQGRAESAPDMATISLGVTTQQREAAAAMRENATQVAAMLAVLADKGIAARDMQTSNLNLHPRYEHRNNQAPQVTGFVASNTLTIRVRDLSSLGNVLDAALGVGANQLHGLRFGFADPQAQQDIARQTAIDDARRKAELYAETAGVAALRVISISETGGASSRPAMMMEAQAMSRSADIPIAEGEVTTQAQVTVVYELVDLE